MSILIHRFVHRQLDNERQYGYNHAPEKKPLGGFWKLMPFFIVKRRAKRKCPTKQIGHLIFAEVFPQTFISIGKAND